jgi:hypothetical protein
MRIYNGSMYGRGTISVAPGNELAELGRLEEAQIEEFCEATTDVSGITSRKARTIAVKFEDGAAEVSEALGAWLIESGRAFAAPQPISVPVNDTAFEAYLDSGRPKYRTPVAVGQPLDRDTREYLADHVVG